MLSSIPELSGREVLPGVYAADRHDIEDLGYTLHDAFDPRPLWEDVLEGKALASDFMLAFERGPRSHGVADTPAQVTERWPALVRDGREFVVLVREEARTDGDQGFRWHTAGAYIGERERRHEYFGDEEGFERVTLFSIFQVTGRP